MERLKRTRRRLGRGMHMVEVTKTIRNVDAESFRSFRAKAVELGYSTGAALTEAIRLWVGARNRRMSVRAEVDGSVLPAESPA